MTTINFKEYQEKVLDLYEEVYLLLEELGIKWWIHSGALLGLVRHDNELIPWDDDIDIMVTSKQWEENLSKIKSKVEMKGYSLIDFKFIQTNVRADIKFAKIIAKDSYAVEYNGKVTDGTTRPFIDIFFACPSETFSNRKWRKYERLSKTQWIYRKGFDRFTTEKLKPRLTFWANLGSYPLKVIRNKKKVEKFLNKPFNSKGDWSKVKRADNWSGRNFEYDLNAGLIEGRLAGRKAIYSKNYEEELICSYGNDWNTTKKRNPHLFGGKRIEHDIYIKDFLNKNNK